MELLNKKEVIKTYKKSLYVSHESFEMLLNQLPVYNGEDEKSIYQKGFQDGIKERLMRDGKSIYTVIYDFHQNSGTKREVERTFASLDEIGDWLYFHATQKGHANPKDSSWLYAINYDLSPPRRIITTNRENGDEIAVYKIMKNGNTIYHGAKSPDKSIMWDVAVKEWAEKLQRAYEEGHFFDYISYEEAEQKSINRDAELSIAYEEGTAYLSKLIKDMGIEHYEIMDDPDRSLYLIAYSNEKHTEENQLFEIKVDLDRFIQQDIPLPEKVSHNEKPNIWGYEYVLGQDHDWWIYDNSTGMIAATYSYADTEEEVRKAVENGKIDLEWIPENEIDFDI